MAAGGRPVRPDDASARNGGARCDAAYGDCLSGNFRGCVAAASGGFDAVGLWIEPELWTPMLLRESRAALAESGLELLDVEVIWLKPDSAMDEHKRCIDIGVELGAKNVLCVSSDPDHGST